MSKVIIDLSGKVALVTGGVRGIGLAITDRLYDAGATVIITGTCKKQIECLNNNNKDARKIYLTVDFLSQKSIESFLNYISTYSCIDILVNNAGVNRIADNTNTTNHDYNFIMDVNLKGAYILIREISKKMINNKYGRIVNITSIWSHVTRPGRSLYSSSKYALDGLSKTVAIELADSNIMVNSVGPGFTRTDMTDTTNTPEEIEKIISNIPARRMADPVEIANLVIFLVSNLNTYITGQNIMIDGGYSNV